MQRGGPTGPTIYGHLLARYKETNIAVNLLGLQQNAHHNVTSTPRAELDHHH